jgi:DNA polymerase-1
MEHLAVVEKKLREDIFQLDLQLNAYFPKVNWGSPQQVAEVLFDKIGLDPLDRTEAGKPSTSESVLKRLAEQHPVPNLLMKRRAAQQQLSFFVEGWKPYIIKGRIHPSFKIHGTTTGRLSCANPNLQQVPRDFYIRQLITAKPGYVLIEADLSQIELRILAELSGDPEMMRCFQTGIDVHWLTALREIFRGGAYHDEVIATCISITRKNHLEYEDCHEILLKAGPDLAAEIGPKKSDVWPGWKEVRKYAKAINFGYAFGMWWKKFKDYARDNYDVVVTDEQAQASRQNYFDLYAKLPGWHNRQKAFARRHGYVRSLTGRKRRLPRAMDNFESFEKGEAERQSINSPVQGFASDLNLMVALAMRKQFSPKVFQLVGTVHDAILAEVRIDKVKEVVKFLRMILKHPPLLDEFDISMRVPLDGEIKIGPWGQGVSPEKWRP